MPNNNNYITKENLAKVEEVREIPTYQPKYTDEEVAKLKEIFIAEQKEAIKKYQIKTSPLSPEARSKVIRKWGSDYVSEDREGYGPVWSEGGSFGRSVVREIEEEREERRKARGWDEEKKLCPRCRRVLISKYSEYCGDRSCMTEEEKKKSYEDTKTAIGATLTIAGFLFPPAAVAGLTTFVGASGATMFVAGKASNDSELAESGGSFLESVAGEIGKGIAKGIGKAIFKE